MWEILQAIFEFVGKFTFVETVYISVIKTNLGVYFVEHRFSANKETTSDRFSATNNSRSTIPLGSDAEISLLASQHITELTQEGDSIEPASGTAVQDLVFQVL